MRIKGNKDNVNEFHKRMSDYDMPNHLWRMFETDIYDEYDNGDGTITIDVAGSCAWSIESCCRTSGYSNGIDLFEVNSKELNLEIESWSDECGMCFQEHYVILKGDLVCDECVDWCEYYLCDYETKEDAERELEIEITDEEWEGDEDFISRGGFGDWDFSI
jgi:hypothetical protein